MQVCAYLHFRYILSQLTKFHLNLLVCERVCIKKKKKKNFNECHVSLHLIQNNHVSKYFHGSLCFSFGPYGNVETEFFTRTLLFVSSLGRKASSHLRKINLKIYERLISIYSEITTNQQRRYKHCFLKKVKRSFQNAI